MKKNVSTTRIKALGGGDWICIYGRILYSKLYNNNIIFIVLFVVTS